MCGKRNGKHTIWPINSKKLIFYKTLHVLKCKVRINTLARKGNSQTGCVILKPEVTSWKRDPRPGSDILNPESTLDPQNESDNLEKGL